jgi:bifunctional DNA-binding transcriptional regulator/antitoxin component of YhaV-PrlF toxin-antitoxin module
MTTTVETIQINAQGQVTLPEATRQKHGWDADTRLEVIEEGGKVILQKAEASESEFKQWLRSVAGSANAGLTTDEIMEMTRGED